MQLVLAIGMVIAAVGGAYYFTLRSDQRRDAREDERRREERARNAASSGLPPDERPVFDPNCQGAECLARDILEDGDAENNQHVDRTFRLAYWTVLDAGGGIAEAMIVAMRQACWARDSRKQVFDRLYSKHLINASQAGRLKSDADRRIPAGYGRLPCDSIPGPDPGVQILKS